MLTTWLLTLRESREWTEHGVVVFLVGSEAESEHASDGVNAILSCGLLRFKMIFFEEGALIRGRTTVCWSAVVARGWERLGAVDLDG